MKISRRLAIASRNMNLLLGGRLKLEDLAVIGKRKSPNVSQDQFKSLVSPKSGELALDLGCGSRPNNFFGFDEVMGIDLRTSEDHKVLAADLSAQQIPFESEKVTLVTCFDFLEHIPRWERIDGAVRFPFIELMNDIHRTLVPSGLLFSRTPAFPSDKAFRDPTHINFITEETFPKYYCGQTMARMYGFEGRFELVKQGWDGGHLLTLMRKA